MIINKIQVLTKAGFIFFGLVLAAIFIELLSITIIYIYQIKQESANSQSFKAKHDITILALGESTTQSGGTNSWPAQLEKILNQKNLGHSFSVINEGRSSITTDKILNKLQDNLDKYHPDIVISMMGINDKGGASVVKLQPESPSLQLYFWENLHFVKLFKYLLSQLISPAYADVNQNLLQLTRDLSVEQKYDKVEQIINQFPTTLQNKDQYLIKRDFYRTMQRHLDVVTLANQALSIWPTDYIIYLTLGDAYRNLGKTENALTVYNQALKINSTDPDIYKALGRLFREDLKDDETANQYFQTAINLIKEDLKSRPKDVHILSNLEEVYRLENSSQAADEVFKNILGINFTTGSNYLTLQNILKQEGIKLIAVQYPIRNVQTLKEMLEVSPDVVFVDNEASFKQAVDAEGYKKYFDDHFGGDFGHATRAGNYLLAENIARVVEEVVRNSLK